MMSKVKSYSQSKASLKRKRSPFADRNEGNYYKKGKKQVEDVHSEEDNEDDEDDDSDDDDSSSNWSSEDENQESEERKNDNNNKEEDEIDPNVPLYQLLQERQQQQAVSSSSHPQPLKTKKIKTPIHPTQDSETDSESERKRKKNAPAEMRSDRPVKRLRIDADNSKRKFIDPRFVDYTGDLSTNHYAKNYQFIEEMKENELQSLTTKYKKLKNPQMKEELRLEINKVKQQLNERKLTLTAMNKYEELKTIEKEKQKTIGKKPFYFKNSFKKDLLNEERFKQLKKEKKLKKFMEKKTKKNAQKERRTIPQQRFFNQENS